MGAQIAAHFANAGIASLLLDLPSQEDDPSSTARNAVEALTRMQPAPLYSPDRLKLIEAGNFEEDLQRVTECQWIIEAVVERLDIKKELWHRVEPFRSPDAVVSTNTSGLSINRIAANCGPEFRRFWLGTHFFNPPRYLKLVEIIPGKETDPEVLKWVRSAAEELLGKGVVQAKDTPNFIANRIGTFFSMRSLELMENCDLTIEEVDALTGPLIGLPKTAIFRLADLVGLDVLLMVAKNLYENVPQDPWRDRLKPPQLLKKMVARGWLGRKAGQGFYKKEESKFLVLDSATMDYRPQNKIAFPELAEMSREDELGKRISFLISGGGRASQFLWPLIRDSLAYCADKVPEIADRTYQIDRAMRWGFNWGLGPFQIWEAAGVKELVDRMTEEGLELPLWIEDLLQTGEPSFYPLGATCRFYFDVHQHEFQEMPSERQRINLLLLKKWARTVHSSEEASLVDLGKGVACLEFHSKANSITGSILQSSERALAEVEKNFLGLVLGNQGKNFSVGANLSRLAEAIEAGEWDRIEDQVRRFQSLNQSFGACPFPVVAAPFQKTLAGGAEICLGADRIVASAETYMGLVEVGVGLIPAGGGTKEMMRRHFLQLPDSEATLILALKEVFRIIGRAKVSGSAHEAARMKFLSPEDLVEMHPDRLLYRAKQEVLSMIEGGYRPRDSSRTIPAVGAAGLAVLKVGIHLMRRAGFISSYEALIGQKLALVLTGGDLNHRVEVDEAQLLELEREAFLSLCGEAKTLERIRYMLQTGKPLRN